MISYRQANCLPIRSDPTTEEDIPRANKKEKHYKRHKIKRINETFKVIESESNPVLIWRLISPWPFGDKNRHLPEIVLFDGIPRIPSI